MTEVGKTQGYTGCKCKKEVSKIEEDGDDAGKEEDEDMRGVFFKVKQENLHELGDCLEDNDVWCGRSMRWREG